MVYLGPTRGRLCVCSQDLIYARKTAEIFDIEFHECIMPTQVSKELVLKIIQQYDRKKKTDVECIYPFYFMLEKLKEKTLITGSCSDGHFCVSKKGMIHYKHTIEKLHEFRDGLFNNPDYAQARTLGLIAEKEFNKKIDNPFNKRPVVDYFYDKTWIEINKPHQKQPILDMFPDKFAKVKIFNHTNLQCGDSQIREMFEPLLKDEELNLKNRKRMLDLYRDIHRRHYGV